MANTLMTSSLKSPTPRKAPATSAPPSKARSRKGSSAAGTKRKIKDKHSSPTQATPKKKKNGNSAPAVQPVPGTLQKAQHEDVADPAQMVHSNRDVWLPLHDGHGICYMLTPFDTPVHSSQPTNEDQTQPEHAQQPPSSNGDPPASSEPIGRMIMHLLVLVTKSNPALLPSSPTESILSAHIDDITSKMWGLAIFQQDGKIMNEVTKYAAVLSEVKLRALARLNFLPSWWVLREQVVAGFQRTGKLVDDTTMTMQWRNAGTYVMKIMDRTQRQRAVQEDKGTKQDSIKIPVN
ncbi:hypothetical protein EK21DRAFT_105823 [Setomelanomma holmii]|uniref:Uncharacterized protein n=1 Tax=Setomelanomma holmii TaxID=210430 RepID=A0A9P4HMZ7_9PLEO|nr:hypothetical protein EK21DRAFT_105823 [Setomelanomma holmii]